MYVKTHFRIVAFVELILLIIKVHGDGTIGVKLVSYTSPGTLTNGHCCDNWPVCNNACDFKFSICLADQDDETDDIDGSSCAYGRHETRVVKKNRNSVVFRSNMGGVRNPLQVQVQGTVFGLVKLLVEVKDHDSTSSSDKVDVLSSDITIGKAVESHELRSRTTLVVETVLVCSDDWYGEFCGEHCPTADHDNYDCDPDTGRKLCKIGWIGRNCETQYKIHEDETEQI